MKTLILAAIRCSLMFTAVAALSLAYPASVQANWALYEYTGNHFTNATGPYTTSDFVTVMVKLPGNPLLPNNNVTFDITNPPLDFTATDGVQTFTPSNIDPTQLMQFTFYTDGTGAIAQWFVEVGRLDPFVGLIDTMNINFPPVSAQDDAQRGFPAGAAGNIGTPGQWRLVATGVPDAGSTLSLMTLTLMALGLVARRFQRATA